LAFCSHDLRDFNASLKSLSSNFNNSVPEKLTNVHNINIFTKKKTIKAHSHLGSKAESKKAESQLELALVISSVYKQYIREA